MPSARVACGSKYGKEARLVLKILPHMGRDKARLKPRDQRTDVWVMREFIGAVGHHYDRS